MKQSNLSIKTKSFHMHLLFLFPPIVPGTIGYFNMFYCQLQLFLLMGQSDSKKKIQQQFDIYKIEKDGNALLKSKKDSKEYLMRIVTCASQADMDRLKALLECRAQLKNHHLLTLVEIKQKQQDFICSIHYKMYLVLEYSFKNLAQEVKERSSSPQKSYFQESDIWSILYSCCTALNVLYSNGATHESLTAQQIFINKDGFVKIAEPLLYGLEKNHLQALRTKDQNVINVHLSPEIIGCLDDQNFFYYDKEKSDIFVLAMIVIDIALLSNHYLYDPAKKRPLFEDIRGLLAQVAERYSNNLVTVLSEMVKIQSRMRPNLSQIIDKVEKFNNIGEDYTVQTQSNMKSNQISSERGQQKFIFQKILNKQDFEDVKKKTEPIAPVVYAVGPQEQSLTIKEPVILFNQQNFDGRVFAVTPQQSNFQGPQYPILQGIQQQTVFQGPQQPYSQKIIRVINEQTIPLPIQENFNLYERSRSIDSIKVTSKEYSHVEQVKMSPSKPAPPTPPRQVQYESKKSNQPLFSHDIPEIYSILMSSKNGFKNETVNKQQKEAVVGKEYAPLPPFNNTDNQRVVRVTNLRHFPYESVSRAGDDSQLPPFQPMELRKNISHTQSQKQPPSNYFKKEFEQPAPDPFSSPKPVNNAFSSSPIKPSPFAGSNPFPGSFTASSVPFAGSAAGVYGAGNSSPIVSSSFIPNFPSPRQGQSFTCRSGFSHLAHLHNQDGEDVKLEFVKQDIPDRGRYEGYKCNDQKNGHGTLYFKDGGHYEGEWKNDKMHGFGKLYYENGKIAYEGHWENDEFNGQGRVYNSEPVTFSEEFNYKDFSELGNRWTYYEGQFKNDSKHGKGYIKLTNGEMFEGIFDHDMIEGNGIFYKRKGEIVIGFWIDNKLFLNQSYEHEKK